ncbi:MAG: sugar phosphate isomerase/epimerase family protein [Rhodomicrobium sp.]
MQSGLRASKKRGEAMAAVRGAGFSSGIAEDPNFELLGRNLDEAVELGLEFVELPLFAMDIVAGGRILPAQLRRLKTALAGRGPSYTAHGPIAVNFMQPREVLARHIAVARAAIEVAAEIGAVHLVLHTGHTPPGQSEADIEAAYAAQREAYASLGEIAAIHALVIAVENIFVTEAGAHTALPSRLAREIEAIDHPNVRGCLDFSHAAITCTAQGADYLGEVAALGRVSKHLHIHDSFGDPLQLRTYARSERVAYGLGDLHLPIGWGNLPWQDLMARLEFEPDAIFNLELPVPYWFEVPGSVRAMREMMAIYSARRTNA